MKNTNLIIKTAVIVSAAASVFSIVTMIRAIIIKANMALPIIQLVGSIAIFAVCFIMFRNLSGSKEEEETDEEEDRLDDDSAKSDEKKREKKSKTGSRVRARRIENKKADPAEEAVSEDDKAEEAVDELYEKYHLSEFEEKKEESAGEEISEEISEE